MLRTILIALYLFSTQVSSAQQITISGKVVTDSLQPLKYVSIGVTNQPIGTVSDDFGNFKLRFNKDSISANDSLKLSIIGYHSKCLALSQLIKTEKENPYLVVLNKKLVELSEVIITSPKGNTKTIGTHQKSLMNMYVNFAQSGLSNQNLGSEIGRKFHIAKKITKIEALRFFISQNNFDSIKLRVNVYSIKRSKPYQNLLNENIYLNLENKRKGWIEIDLADYGIMVSENVIVSLEWISKSTKGSVLNLPIVMPTKHAHFYKYGSQNSWRRFNAMSTYMELKITQ